MASSTHSTHEGVTHADKAMDSLSSRPDEDVISDENRSFAASEFFDLTTRLTHVLAAHGLGGGDTVAILTSVAIEAIAIRYAATRLECATVLCPDAGTPQRLSVFLSRISADAAFPRTTCRRHPWPIVIVDRIPSTEQGKPHRQQVTDLIRPPKHR
ncbi:AMP-binding protein [Williamsia sp. 1138]|uniref:AMP-binding protein n=1 Tax=Williamsia sp. 1138 TaxID=1903117 RepID=UPI00143D8828|nr:AMP-binding protein [Williamsia sp. 1138]